MSFRPVTSGRIRKMRNRRWFVRAHDPAGHVHWVKVTASVAGAFAESVERADGSGHLVADWHGGDSSVYLTIE